MLQNQIEWKPIDIYLKFDRSNESLNEYLKSIIEFQTLNYDISFFCQRGEKYLVLFDYMNTILNALGKDRQEHQIEIWSISYRGAIIQQIPDYFEMDFTIQDFQKSIQCKSMCWQG